MVEEPSDVKQLSLNQMCKIGLMIRGKVFHSPRIPGIRSDPVETVNILQDSATFRLVYKKSSQTSLSISCSFSFLCRGELI
jgi:hypothetical protein